MAALGNHFSHAAGFSSLDNAEGLFSRDFRASPLEIQVHEQLIDLQTVLDERDFQFLALQAGAHGLEGLTRMLAGGVRGGKIAAVERNLSDKQMGLVDKYWRLDVGQYAYSVVALASCRVEVPDIEGD